MYTVAAFLVKDWTHVFSGPLAALPDRGEKIQINQLRYTVLARMFIVGHLDGQLTVQLRLELAGENA